jgi:integrase/recombinase XerC
MGNARLEVEPMTATAALAPVAFAPLTSDELPVSRLVEAFLAGRNARTLRAYRQDLEAFRLYVKAATLDDAARVLLSRGHGEANALALAYKARLLELRRSASTVNRHLAALRSLVKLARTLGMVPWSLEVENLPVEAYRDTRGPGWSGFRRLVNELAGLPDAKATRDHSILHLLFDLALRRGEVVSLDLEDVDLEAGRLAVLGKGRTGKVALTLPEPTQASLTSWLAVRGTEPGPLFQNFDRAGKGARLTGTSVYRTVRDLGKAAGLTVRPHGLRHAAITEALDATRGDVRAVQKFSRHRDLRVLNAYDDNRADLAGDVARLVAAAGCKAYRGTKSQKVDKGDKA